MKTSATSHSHSLLVSVVVDGFGFEYSASYGQMKSRYRYLSDQRERISVRWPGVRSPRGPFVAIMPLTDFHWLAFGSAVKAKSDFELELLITLESSCAYTLIENKQSRAIAGESRIFFFIFPLEIVSPKL